MGTELFLDEHDVFLSSFGLQSHQPLAKRLQTMKLQGAFSLSASSEAAQAEVLHSENLGETSSLVPFVHLL